MTVIDPATNLGKLRLRCADVSPIPFLPDSVYTQTLVDTDDNLPQSAKICAAYILGQLAFKTHRKMGLQLEVWGKEAFDSYSKYLIMITTNPNFMDVSPIAQVTSAEFDQIVDFQANWNANYTNITESQQLARNADTSPNDNSRTGWSGT